MFDLPAGRPRPESVNASRVRVFRVEVGKPFFVRTLSDQLDGLFTHHVKGNGKQKGSSLYCPGADCNCSLQKLPRVWKGYLAVEAWCPVDVLWLPTVLEVTEKLEERMRPVYARGQVWEIFRTARPQGKGSFVDGRLGESLPEETLPAPFDFMPVLQLLYHCVALQLGQKNPLPAPAFLTPSIGEPPNALKPKATKPKQAEGLSHWQELRAKQAQANGVASDNAQKH